MKEDRANKADDKASSVSTSHSYSSGVGQGGQPVRSDSPTEFTPQEWKRVVLTRVVTYAAVVLVLLAAIVLHFSWRRPDALAVNLTTLWKM